MCAFGGKIQWRIERSLGTELLRGLRGRQEAILHAAADERRGLHNPRVLLGIQPAPPCLRARCGTRCADSEEKEQLEKEGDASGMVGLNCAGGRGGDIIDGVVLWCDRVGGN